MHLKKQKWHSIAVPIALISFFIGGQTVYSQERGSGFASPPERRMEQFSLEKETPDDIAEKETRWMKKKLKLKKEQLQRVKAINAVYAFKREDYKKAMGSKDNGNNQKILEKLDKEKDDELRKVFTEKQYNTYLKKKPELAEKIRSKSNEARQPPSRPSGGSF